jgi:hypothetical protein
MFSGVFVAFLERSLGAMVVHVRKKDDVTTVATTTIIVVWLVGVLALSSLGVARGIVNLKT